LAQAQLLIRPVGLIIKFTEAWRVNGFQDPNRYKILGVALGWLQGHSVGAFSIASVPPSVYLHVKICIKLVKKIVLSLFILMSVLINLVFLIN